MGDTFFCICRHCGGRRSITAGGRRAIYAEDPTAPTDLFAENDCDCPKPSAMLAVVACEICGETGKHWLGCEYIGLPEIPKDEPRKGLVH